MSADNKIKNDEFDAKDFANKLEEHKKNVKEFDEQKEKHAQDVLAHQANVSEHNKSKANDYQVIEDYYEKMLQRDKKIRADEILKGHEALKTYVKHQKNNLDKMTMSEQSDEIKDEIVDRVRQALQNDNKISGLDKFKIEEALEAYDGFLNLSEEEDDSGYEEERGLSAAEMYAQFNNAKTDTKRGTKLAATKALLHHQELVQ